MDAAVALFSKKGYAAVGIREIAREANVNISMISYYYQGKAGILKMIMEKYFNDYNSMLDIFSDINEEPEKAVRVFTHNLVNYLKENRESAMVAYNMIPILVDEIEEWKSDKLRESMDKMRGLIRMFDMDAEDILFVGAIGPALISIIFTKFQRLPEIKKNWDLELDDALYHRYAEVVATLFLNGLNGLKANHTGA